MLLAPFDLIHPFLPCAWCREIMDENKNSFCIGAIVTAESKDSVRQLQSSGAQVFLTATEKYVVAMVPTNVSDARKAGVDLLFGLCSQGCHKNLKRGLLKESFIENLN